MCSIMDITHILLMHTLDFDEVPRGIFATKEPTDEVVRGMYSSGDVLLTCFDKNMDM